MSVIDLPALRNLNPGNLEYNPDIPYEGLASPPSDGKFFIFTSAQYGIRAIMETLHAYHFKHGLNTPKDIVTRYAPEKTATNPNENDTQAYINAVCSWNGWKEDQVLNFTDPHTYIGFAQSVAVHESGINPNHFPVAWYSDSVYQEAFALTGFQA